MKTRAQKSEDLKLISPPRSDSLHGGLLLLQMFYFLFIFLFQRKISKIRRLISVKFCTMISSRSNVMMPLQNFKGPTPKKFYGPKTCKIWPNFGWLQISPERMKIFKIGQVHFVLRFLPRGVKEFWWTVVHQSRKLSSEIILTQIDFFARTFLGL